MWDYNDKGMNKALRKTISYRIITILVTLITVYMFTQNVYYMTAITVTNQAILSIIYYYHEKWWCKKK
jgi:uncharacterized membrane protein